MDRELVGADGVVVEVDSDAGVVLRHRRPGLDVVVPGGHVVNTILS